VYFRGWDTTSDTMMESTQAAGIPINMYLRLVIFFMKNNFLSQ